MRFDCGETWAEKAKRLSRWHRWFAWHPVEVGPHDCRWLEYVERRERVTMYDVWYEYRAPKSG